ncbi:hypothetical protein D3C73_1037790 [compost metagenome]
MVPGHGPRGGLARGSGWGVVVNVGQGGRETGAQAEPSQHAKQGEDGDVRGKGNADGEQGEACHAGDQQFAASELVGERRDEESAEAHAHQRNGGCEGGSDSVESKLAGLDECWDDGAQDHEVEAVQDHGQPTEPNRPLGAAGR